VWPAVSARSRLAVGAALVLAFAVLPVLPGAPRRERDPSAEASVALGPAGKTPRYRLVGCRSHGGPYRGGPPRRQVALSFDDGPAADTPAFVSMLERNRATATFFLIGRQISARLRPTLLREVRDGDVLGDHTFSHPNLLLAGGVRKQLARPIGEIHALTGYTPCLFRPPYGAVDTTVTGVARSLGLATVLWNVDPADWARPGSAAIEQRVLAQVRPGSIVISHDGGGPRGETLAAYPAIIAALRKRGYHLVTIPQLLGFRPVYESCARLCEGIGVPRQRLPRDAILQRAP
jgi:peptidoglycan/xylan/chitin deacetylase (PgdA/CDA1 family)